MLFYLLCTYRFFLKGFFLGGGGARREIWELLLQFCCMEILKTYIY